MTKDLPEANHVLLLGHRGARRCAPENTLTAFELALEHGCDGFEFDVRCSRDGRAVICHDPRYHRLDISESTFDSLCAVTPSLPVLERVLAEFHRRAFLYIELKVGGLAEAVVAMLREHPPEKGYVVASFLADVLEDVHARDTRVPLGLIADGKRELARWTNLPLEFVMPHYSLVSSGLVDEVHRAGRRVLAWTVNSERRIRALADLGVDGLVSDDTELLCRVFGRR